jgi:hypothetical protein
MARTIGDVALDIQKAWPKPYFGAVPYLNAMKALIDKNSKFGCESAEEIVLYFLANAGTFRGPVAKALKVELKTMIGRK